MELKATGYGLDEQGSGKVVMSRYMFFNEDYMLGIQEKTLNR